MARKIESRSELWGEGFRPIVLGAYADGLGKTAIQRMLLDDYGIEVSYKLLSDAIDTFGDKKTLMAVMSKTELRELQKMALADLGRAASRFDELERENPDLKRLQFWAEEKRAWYDRAIKHVKPDTPLVAIQNNSVNLLPSLMEEFKDHPDLAQRLVSKLRAEVVDIAENVPEPKD